MVNQTMTRFTINQRIKQQSSEITNKAVIKIYNNASNL